MLHKRVTDTHTTPGNLLKFLEETQYINYCVLGNVVDDKIGASVVGNEMQLEGDNITTTRTLEGGEYDDLVKLTSMHRSVHTLRDGRYIIVSVAWVNSGDLKLLKLFPQVVKIDETSYTNNGKLPHMTFSAKTHSKMGGLKH